MKLIRQAHVIAYPKICEESKSLGVAPPIIEWRAKVTVAGTTYAGLYDGKDKILFNRNSIKKLIEEGISTDSLLKVIIYGYFHEFKHYIDVKIHGLSKTNYRLNKDKYEDEADTYGDKMLLILGYSF